MAYTELDLAQVERRVLAAERCIARQREILSQHLEAALPSESVLELLAEFQITLAKLRRERTTVRAQIAAATTRRLIESFWSLTAERRRSLVEAS